MNRVGTKLRCSYVLRHKSHLISRNVSDVHHRGQPTVTQLLRTKAGVHLTKAILGCTGVLLSASVANTVMAAENEETPAAPAPVGDSPVVVEAAATVIAEEKPDTSSSVPIEEKQEAPAPSLPEEKQETPAPTEEVPAPTGEAPTPTADAQDTSASAPAPAEAESAPVVEEVVKDDVVKKADLLYDEMKYEDIYNLLHPHAEEKNDEILWRLGRATYEKAKAAPADSQKVLYKEALGYVEAALSLNDNNFAVHKWMSILIDYVYGYEGNKARISQSYNVKHHMEKACELNPTDGTSRYLLGYWYYTIAEIPWYQRKIASLIFATPPSGTYQDALDQCLHAEKLEPNFYSKNLLMIGKCYEKLGNREEAIVYIRKVKEYLIKTADDRESVDEATQLLKKFGVV
ncbi:regulator of microtubule dynamics protein 1-like [Oratosquilla oratoria]|uniref:regulator of microtubule dynamics protein 1-like n=1 Tax=Oratosquilla oratoria TaxID=337810 RepID=UPI003F771E5E